MSIFDDFIGHVVLVRSSDSGVHVGRLLRVDGDQVVLGDSERLWYWVGNGGIALSGVAKYGFNRTKSKIDSVVDKMAVFGVCEIILMSDEAVSKCE